MKKIIVIAIASGMLVAGLVMPNIYAWKFSLSSKGECQPDGSYLITWKLDNSSEPETLSVVKSSNEGQTVRAAAATVSQARLRAQAKIVSSAAHQTS